MATEYKVRLVHKISPRDTDVKSAIFSDNVFTSANTLGKALRQAGILHKGGRLRSFRAEGEGFVAFPSRGSPWHSFVITRS